MIYSLIGLILIIIKVILLIFEGCFWIIHIIYNVIIKLIDVNRARHSFRDGVLCCAEGHPVQTEGEAYECSACNYTYIGSIWVCSNPECGAVTPYINCSICGISIRNPYRWGRL